MSLYLEMRYAALLSARFRNYKMRQRQYNFSCPLCGDSAKKRTKARGYIYESDGQLWFKCHNCSVAKPFWMFLREQDSTLFREFTREKFAKPEEEEEVVPEVFKGPRPVFYNRIPDLFAHCEPIASLDDDHPAKRYVLGRKIPAEFHTSLYHVANFKAFTNLHKPGKFEDTTNDEPRVVIPFLSEDGKEVIGFHGRSFTGIDPKYYAIRIKPDDAMIYGLDKLDLTKTVHVVEGPFDSMFITNCVAVGTAALYRFNRKDTDRVYIPDNTPRNREIVRIMQNLIEAGEKVFIWPEELSDFKDINAAILGGYSKEQMQQIISNSTWSGNAAHLRFSQFKKVTL